MRTVTPTVLEESTFSIDVDALHRPDGDKPEARVIEQDQADAAFGAGVSDAYGSGWATPL